jgi:hypothetical protein
VEHFQEKWKPVFRFENATTQWSTFRKSGKRFSGSKMRQYKALVAPTVAIIRARAPRFVP